MRFMEEAGEDYIDYNESIINAYPFSMWLFGKGYINNEAIEKFCEMNHLSIQDILCDEILFPNTYGCDGVAQVKVYSLLAEYMSSVKAFRQRLYDSVNDEASNFEDEEFYKNEDGISLACIINEEDMIGEEYTKEKFLQNGKDVWDLSYKEQWNLANSITILEADELAIEE
jgi:hypothetical protein